MSSCNEGRRKNHGCRCNNNSPRYARDRIALLCIRFENFLRFHYARRAYVLFYVSGSLSAVIRANIALFPKTANFYFI